MFASPDFGLTVHQMLFYAISSFILGVICFQIIKNLLEWHRNSQAPREIQPNWLPREHAFLAMK